MIKASWDAASRSEVTLRTHMPQTHLTGAVHAAVEAPRPEWLERPVDVNALAPDLWSATVSRRESGELQVGGLGVTEILKQSGGSPVYVMDEEDFRSRARAFKEAFEGWDVYYASKAFTCRAVVRWAAEEGLRVDVCSLGELRVALDAGVDPALIGHHGNNKSEAELEYAVTHGVGRIVVDSLAEISRLADICERLDKRANVMVRVTAGVKAHTHEHIATAHEDQKFGFSITNGQAMVAMVRCHANPHLDLRGIHSHIGSQIFGTSGFEIATRRTMKLLSQFAGATDTELPELDLGGGFGIRYTTQDHPATPKTLAAGLREIVTHEARGYQLQVPQMSIEPGRAIVGPSMLALYTVGTIKPVDLDGGQQRVYVSVDGGMSDNLRPALYGADYSATLASRSSEASPVLCRIVGMHCESGDILVNDEFMPSDLCAGDVIAVPASGAYSRVLASNYNYTPRPGVVAVGGGKLRWLIRRESLEDVLAFDVS